MMRTRASRILFSTLLRNLSHLPKASILESSSTTGSLPHLLLPSIPLTLFSTASNRPMRGDRSRDDRSEEHFLRNLNFRNDGEHDSPEKTHQNPPTRMPNSPLRGNQRSEPLRGERNQRSEPLRGERNQRSEPLRGEKRSDFGSEGLFPDLNDEPEKVGRSRRNPNRPMRGEGRETSGLDFESLHQKAPPRFPVRLRGEETNDGSSKTDDQFDDSSVREKGGDQSGDTLFQKLNLGDIGSSKKVEETHQKPSAQISGTESSVSESPSQDADEIFKKMKETGLIPNAVAMLDGLCKDGLFQEAMKLFGLMREKGTIPEVVIYTAVVEGFCKAAKFDDAKRIFRKMQKNGIVPNAFSYTILIQGLCKGGRLEDSVEFCNEMLDAGHLPNVATFTGLVDAFCKEKGVEEAESVVRSLRERGFAVDEKAVREYLDKKGPHSPMVWEAIFGKKQSQRPF